MRQLYSLQIGRALAAIAVVSHHATTASYFFFHEISGNYLKPFEFGYLAVDYFFVLSGFIIAHSTLSLPADREGMRSYILARGIRIYIPYLPVSIAMITVFYFFPSLSLGARDSFSIAASLFLVPAELPTALSVALTLQHEMIFYALFGLCFFGLRNIRFLFLWALPILVLSFFRLPRWASFIVGIQNIEFLLGVMICFLYHTQKLFSLRYLLLVSGVFLVVASILLSLQNIAIAGPHMLIGIGFACVILALAYMEREIDFSQCRLLLLLGSASYAIYLTHGPAISVLARLFFFVHNVYLGFVLFMILSCFIGVLYYQVIEKPLARAKKHWMST